MSLKYDMPYIVRNTFYWIMIPIFELKSQLKNEIAAKIKELLQ